MDQAFGRFGQIQLQMATQPTVIIEYGQYRGAVPLTQCIENADFSLVKIQVPEAMDMGYFETAYLTVLTPEGGLPLPIGGLRRFVGF